MVKTIGKVLFFILAAGLSSRNVQAQATMGSLDQNADQSQGM